MTIKNILFDNDDTLYGLNTRLRQALTAAFLIYVSVKIGIPTDEVMPLRNRLFAKYNVDFSAYLFEKEYGITYDEFVKRTCLSVDLKKNGIGEDSRLAHMLRNTNARMSVLTNNYSEYAWMVLRQLGVAHMFESIIGAKEMGFAAKPDMKAFLRTMGITGYRPEETLFVDDKPGFLLPAKQLGMATALVNANGVGYAEPWIDYKVRDIYDITRILRGIRRSRL